MSQLVVITAISLTGNSDEEQNISKVKAFSLTPSIVTVPELIKLMHSRGSNLVVRSGSTDGPIVKVIEGNPSFIRTKGNDTEKDYLLTLPRF